MIPQRNDRLSLLTEENHYGSNCNNQEFDKAKLGSTSDNRNALRGIDLPLEILVDHIAPFVDRRTYNSCLLLCRKARQTLKSAWWKNGQDQQLPPWPRKLVSRDHACRVRCLTFNEDNTLMACGCSDGKIRCWDVRLGEFPMTSREGHWPDEAVVAVAFGNSNENRMVASSSTDGTIRIWKIRSPKTNKTWHHPRKRIPATRQIDTSTTSSHMTFSRADDDNNSDYGIRAKSLVPLRCTLCVRSDQAVSLHFSPDDLYLVSGHLAVRNARDVITSSTIEIREVRTGLLLRHIEDGGVPIGFLRSSPRLPELDCFPGLSRGTKDVTIISEEEHKLIATCGPNTCLKLWSWNRIECVNNSEKKNSISDGIDHRGSNHHLNIEIGEQSIAVVFPSNLNDNGDDDGDTSEQYSTILKNERCVEKWRLDRFSTVVPLPNDCQQSHIEKGRGACEILVAVINEPSKNSFEVWNTNSPNERKIFCNASPYEIQFSPDGTKIASVDDFNTVKVWRISDGVLLKTFSGGSDDYRSCCNDIFGFESALDDSDDSSLSYTECDFGFSDDGLFPIHELVFSKDSSTVAVISRCYNEVHLFST